MPNVKLRLGRFGVDSQQKGVDLRIAFSLVTHARNAVADVFILVSGDDDLTEAVEEAQVHGVQVILLAVPNAQDRPHGISRHLIRAADGLKIIFPDTIDQAVTKVKSLSAVPSTMTVSQGGPSRAKTPSTGFTAREALGRLVLQLALVRFSTRTELLQPERRRAPVLAPVIMMASRMGPRVRRFARVRLLSAHFAVLLAVLASRVFH